MTDTEEEEITWINITLDRLPSPSAPLAPTVSDCFTLLVQQRATTTTIIIIVISRVKILIQHLSAFKVHTNNGQRMGMATASVNRITG